MPESNHSHDGADLPCREGISISEAAIFTEVDKIRLARRTPTLEELVEQVTSETRHGEME